MCELLIDPRQNNSAIDVDRKVIIDIMNQLYAQTKNNAGELDINKLLILLLDHTMKHFYHEERILIDIGFTGIYSHQKAHNYLIEQITELMEWHENNVEQINIGRINYLYSIYGYHFMIMDEDITKFIMDFCDVDNI